MMLTGGPWWAELDPRGGMNEWGEWGSLSSTAGQEGGSGLDGGSLGHQVVWSDWKVLRAGWVWAAPSVGKASA